MGKGRISTGSDTLHCKERNQCPKLFGTLLTYAHMVSSRAGKFYTVTPVGMELFLGSATLLSVGRAQRPQVLDLLYARTCVRNSRQILQGDQTYQKKIFTRSTTQPSCPGQFFCDTNAISIMSVHFVVWYSDRNSAFSHFLFGFICVLWCGARVLHLCVCFCLNMNTIYRIHPYW